MKHTFTLDGEHAVTKGPRDKSWTASVSIALGSLTTEMVQRLAVYGLQQKVADAASGSTTADEANASMQKAVDAILAGDWTQRTGGGGVDEETMVARSIVRSAMKAKLGSKSPEWAAFTGLNDAAQVAKLDAVRAANEAVFADAIAAKMAERKRDREQRAALSKTADFAI